MFLCPKGGLRSYRRGMGWLVYSIARRWLASMARSRRTPFFPIKALPTAENKF